MCLWPCSYIYPCITKLTHFIHSLISSLISSYSFLRSNQSHQSTYYLVLGTVKEIWEPGKKIKHPQRHGETMQNLRAVNQAVEMCNVNCCTTMPPYIHFYKIFCSSFFPTGFALDFPLHVFTWHMPLPKKFTDRRICKRSRQWKKQDWDSTNNTLESVLGVSESMFKCSQKSWVFSHFLKLSQESCRVDEPEQFIPLSLIHKRKNWVG